MKANYTHIIFILDRSGSMHSIVSDTIGGFNAFLEAQRKQPGECTASLWQFSDFAHCAYASNVVSKAPNLSPLSYVPSGSTALYDAVCQAIDEEGATISRLSPEDRPEKVLVVILTDGAENASKFRHKDDVLSRINHQTSVYNWDFIYLGANQDSFSAAGAMGISHGKTINYAANAVGTQAAFASASSYASVARSAKCVADVNFTQQDRQAAVGAVAAPNSP